MDDEYVEYRCSACKKAIKSKVVKCKACSKLFYHPGCVSKHKILDRNQEYVLCKGSFEEFLTDREKEAGMKKASTAAGRDRTSCTGSIGSPGSFTIPSSGSKGSGIEAKIDWIIKTGKEIKSETACRNEIKVIIKEVVQKELGRVK